jgi:hypothetical protein
MQPVEGCVEVSRESFMGTEVPYTASRPASTLIQEKMTGMEIGSRLQPRESAFMHARLRHNRVGILCGLNGTWVLDLPIYHNSSSPNPHGNHNNKYRYCTTVLYLVPQERWIIWSSAETKTSFSPRTGFELGVSSPDSGVRKVAEVHGTPNHRRTVPSTLTKILIRYEA